MGAPLNCKLPQTDRGDGSIRVERDREKEYSSGLWEQAISTRCKM
jgi:hypothetical protein